MSTIASLDRIGVGIDTARYGHRVSFLRPDCKPAAKPLTVMENRAGYQALQDRLNQLHEQHPTANFHVRIDAAGQYAVNLELFLRSLKLPMTISVGEPKRNKDYQKAHFPAHHRRHREPGHGPFCRRRATQRHLSPVHAHDPVARSCRTAEVQGQADDSGQGDGGMGDRLGVGITAGAGSMLSEPSQLEELQRLTKPHEETDLAASQAVVLASRATPRSPGLGAPPRRRGSALQPGGPGGLQERPTPDTRRGAAECRGRDRLEAGPPEDGVAPRCQDVHALEEERRGLQAGDLDRCIARTAAEPGQRTGHPEVQDQEIVSSRSTQAHIRGGDQPIQGSRRPEGDDTRVGRGGARPRRAADGQLAHVLAAVARPRGRVGGDATRTPRSSTRSSRATPPGCAVRLGRGGPHR